MKGHYRAYLLRMWKEESKHDPRNTWRFSLEDPHTGQRHGFANLSQLERALIAAMKEAMEQTQEQS